MKYKLLRDLPGLKAGATFFLENYMDKLVWKYEINGQKHNCIDNWKNDLLNAHSGNLDWFTPLTSQEDERKEE